MAREFMIKTVQGGQVVGEQTGVVLYIKRHTFALIPKVGRKPVQSFWVKAKRENSKGDVMAGIYYRPPKEEDDNDNKND